MYNERQVTSHVLFSLTLSVSKRAELYCSIKYLSASETKIDTNSEFFKVLEIRRKVSLILEHEKRTRKKRNDFNIYRCEK